MEHSLVYNDRFHFAGLFHRAIAQSGSALNPWGFDRKPRLRAFSFGEALGCKTDDSQKLVDFLRTVPPKRLIEAIPRARKFEAVSLFIPQRALCAHKFHKLNLSSSDHFPHHRLYNFITFFHSSRKCLTKPRVVQYF
jgi:carboxylesterase type B